MLERRFYAAGFAAYVKSACMKLLIAFTIASLVTVVLAFTESCTHMCMYVFLAIIVCQPWLAFGWALSAAGLVTLGDATPALVATLAGLNVVIGVAFIFFMRRSGKRRAG